jgi:thiamine-monophosphate kinase
VKTLRDIGEDALIERLIQLIPKDQNPAAGPGDDCAVIDPGPHSNTVLLLKTDALVENVHYLPETPARAVGWKSVARVMSDFAAMGGTPERFLITLALAPETDIAWVENLYRGIGDCLEKYGGYLAGGETCSIPSGSLSVISVAATGSAFRKNIILRSTAQAGQSIFVTGYLGGSIKGKHLKFTPRLAEAKWLVEHFKPTAMMDVSDGLAKDLPRLAAASRCGFQIDLSSLPASAGCTTEQALGDGEDFELLFTIPSEITSALVAEWPEEFPQLSEIGKLVDLADSQSLKGGWDHFPSE